MRVRESWITPLSPFRGSLLSYQLRCPWLWCLVAVTLDKEADLTPCLVGYFKTTHTKGCPCSLSTLSHCTLNPTFPLCAPLLLFKFVLVRSIKFNSLSKFQLYNTVLLTLVTMLYVRSSNLIRLEVSTLLPGSPYFPHSQPLGNHFSTPYLNISSFLMLPIHLTT